MIGLSEFIKDKQKLKNNNKKFISSNAIKLPIKNKIKVILIDFTYVVYKIYKIETTEILNS